MSIKTDSTPVEDAKDPETCNIFSLFKLVADESEQAELAQRYRAGGMGYGDAKKQLLTRIDEHFAPARERRRVLAADPDTVEDILVAGATHARALACETMERVYQATGLTKARTLQERP
jgi:tryptophanyl-tRNA synthetase